MEKPARPTLSIRVKMVAAVMASALVFTFFVYFISSEILLKSYARIENDQTLENVQRVSDAMANTIDQLDIKLIDWAWWDDTYAFIHDQNVAYRESNLTPSSLATLKINGMVFVDENGNVIFSQMIDFNTQAPLPMDGILDHLKLHHELITHDAKTSPVTGIISLPDGPAYVASEPILTSQGDGPIRGSLIFVKYLTSDEVKKLATLTHLDVEMYPYDGPTLPADVAIAKRAFEDGQDKFVRPLSDNLVAGYDVVEDLYGAPLLLLRVQTLRPVYQQGKATFTIYGIMMGAVAPAFGLLVLFMIQFLVFRRLTRLNKELEKIGEASTVTLRVTEGPQDELGELETTMNGMLSEIEASQIDLEKFKLAVENADEHVIITDPDGKVLYANPSAEKITGYAQSEMLGKTPSLWGGQMPATFYKQLWKTIAKDKKTFAGEVNNKRKDGEKYLASVQISPILDERRNVKFFVGLEQDITARRQAEVDRERYAAELKTAKESVETEVKRKTKELSEERARFLASVNSLQIGFTIIDVDGSLLLKNPALPALLGATEELATIADISKILDGGLDLGQKLKDCTDKHCVVDIGELAFGRKYLRIFITPVFADGDGALPLGGVLLVEDITEAKTIEKAKTEFVSLASHQLRTPLSTINWYIEMLLSGDAGKITKNQKTYLAEISTGNKRMVALVNALLNVSRLDLGHLAITVRPTDIRDVVSQTVQSFHEKAHDQKLKVTETYDELPLVPVDEKYFRMAVENVFLNALKYTPEMGSVDVRVKYLQIGDTFGGRKMDALSVGIAVADTGYGIPEQQQKKVFDKLFRADNVLDKDEEGTGLGLYIVKAILDQSGGTIWFESKENVGTTFYITFPLTGMKAQEGAKTLS